MEKLDLEKSVDLFIQTQNQKYFTQIYKTLNKQMKYFILKYVKDEDLTNSIVSQAFENIYHGLKNGKYNREDNAKFKTWAYACVINVMRLQNKYYQKTILSDTTPSVALKEMYIDPTENEELFIYKTSITNQIFEFIRCKLPSHNNFKTIAQRFFIEKTPITEISSELNLQVPNVKQKIFLIKKLIRQNINYEPHKLT